MGKKEEKKTPLKQNQKNPAIEVKTTDTHIILNSIQFKIVCIEGYLPYLHDKFTHHHFFHMALETKQKIIKVNTEKKEKDKI